jgi:hypothetical protein
LVSPSSGVRCSVAVPQLRQCLTGKREYMSSV